MTQEPLPSQQICHVQPGSLLADWTRDLNLVQEFKHGTCVNNSAWESCEDGSTWNPICTTHKLVLADHRDVEFRLLPYVIEEEETILDAKVNFLFATATRMAQQSPNYVPEDQRESPNIDDLLKKHLKDALRKK